MGIQPIDLQTLYTQMDKVGKQIAGEQKAKEEENVKQAESFNRELMERSVTVQETNEYDKINVNKDGHQENGQQTMHKKKMQSLCKVPMMIILLTQNSEGRLIFQDERIYYYFAFF